MNPTLTLSTSFRRGSSRRFATSAIAAVIAATTLAACGPRDETPLAGRADGATARIAPAAVSVVPETSTVAMNDAVRAGNPVPGANPVQSAPVPAADHAPWPVQTAQALPANDSGPLPPAPRQVAPGVQARAVPLAPAGSITGIDPIRTRPQGSGAGAVVGGVLGGVLGNQFGHGLGRAAMTGVGAAGGAIAGNNVERNYKEAVVGYRVHVRLDNGSTRTFERQSIGNLHVGDRVRLDANGFRRG